jgi:hypothetical protein
MKKGFFSVLELIVNVDKRGEFGILSNKFIEILLNRAL